MRPNQRTRRVNVGGVPMGGGAPCVVQSMLNAPADDVEANLRQIRAL
ncbi:MAG: 4-hydroxy-3-methylbut-2-en-1-yl diphosphate synthase, partial [Coriobacteriia bacterium]